jgi:hypothetical protein
MVVVNFYYFSDPHHNDPSDFRTLADDGNLLRGLLKGAMTPPTGLPSGRHRSICPATRTQQSKGWQLH